MAAFPTDEELAGELGVDPDDFYVEFRESFQIFVDKGLIEILSPRPAESEHRYRLTPRSMNAGEGDEFLVDNPTKTTSRPSSRR